MTLRLPASLLLSAAIGGGVGAWLARAGAPEPAEATCAPPADVTARHRALRDELRGLVEALVAEGRYDCCIQHPCSTCGMRMAGCKCGEGLRAGEPVCEECAMLWRSGQGAEDVDPASVRSFLEAQWEAEARAAASGPGGADGAGHPAGPGAPRGGVAGGAPPAPRATP